MPFFIRSKPKINRLHFETGRNVLILSPHMDDDIIGCGGLIAFLMGKIGSRLGICYMTDGTRGTPDLSHDTGLNEIRKKETRAALDLLGAKDARLIFLDKPDMALEKNNNSIELVMEEIERNRPEWLFVNSSADPHPDHGVCSKIASAALRRLSKIAYPEFIIVYEVYSILPVNAVLDITEIAHLKNAAIKCHVSQMQLHPYNEYILGLNLFRGLSVAELGDKTSRYAEGFWKMTTKEYLHISSKA